MGKITKAKQHISNEGILMKIKETTGFWRIQKWLIIYNSTNYPRTSEEIAKHLAVSKSLVNKTISEYHRFGVSAIETIGKGGCKHAYMTVEQEKEFIDKFNKKADKGQVVTIADIKKDYEKLISRKVHKKNNLQVTKTA